MPNSLLLTLVHGVKLGLASGVSRALDNGSQLLRNYTEATTETGVPVGSPLGRALAPVAEALCDNVSSALSSWRFWNRVISADGAQVQQIAEEAGIGIFNK